MMVERVAKLYYLLFCGYRYREGKIAKRLWLLAIVVVSGEINEVLLRKPATDLFRLPLMFTLHRFYIFFVPRNISKARNPGLHVEKLTPGLPGLKLNLAPTISASGHVRLSLSNSKSLPKTHSQGLLEKM